MRTILFHRKFRRLHGGHLKVWHYFNHVLATEGYDARVLFDVNSSWDRDNPWNAARDHVIDSLDGQPVDVLFVAGRDWQRLEQLGLLDRGLPILNLIQHVRHADEWSIQSRYLARRAIRLCVSEEVAGAVASAGGNGPTVVIPNGVDLPVEITRDACRPTDVLIAGLKQPVLAREAGERLARSGLTLEVLTDHVPRDEFLAAMRRARVTLFLPNREEGFYLPALEGMALGTLVVCPDCIGNRSFVLHEQNALMPAFELPALVEAVERALQLPGAESDRLQEAGLATARRHSPESERAAFTRVLTNLDALWESGETGIAC